MVILNSISGSFKTKMASFTLFDCLKKQKPQCKSVEVGQREGVIMNKHIY